jgi:DNA-binding NarL/FixJ family response regulator
MQAPGDPRSGSAIRQGAEAQITVFSLGPLRQALPAQLAMYLEDEDRFRIIEGNGCYQHARRALAGKHVDLVLVAVNGKESLRNLKSIVNHGRGRKVLISGNCNSPSVLEYIGIGVKGYLDHEVSPTLLKKALMVVSNGEVWFDRRLSSQIAEAYSSQAPEDRTEEIIRRLSAREKEVLQVLTKGYRNRDIADYLHISPETVKVHLSRIYEKLGVADRLSAVLLQQSMENK